MKASTRRTRDGQRIRYLQLAHNEWDPQAKASKTRVLYSFGRADQLDLVAVRRLVQALSRLLDPADALAATTLVGLSFVESRPLGGAWLLDGLWRQLGIDTIVAGLLGSKRREVEVDRVLFALVANRALAPSSKLAAAAWVSHDVHIPGLEQVSDDACYRAMDDLIKIEPAPPVVRVDHPERAVLQKHQQPQAGVRVTVLGYGPVEQHREDPPHHDDLATERQVPDGPAPGTARRRGCPTSPPAGATPHRCRCGPDHPPRRGVGAAGAERPPQPNIYRWLCHKPGLYYASGRNYIDVYLYLEPGRSTLVTGPVGPAP